VSLKGNLEDVSVVDVIQLIYIGGRTGTLAIQGPTAAARFGFQRGRMTNAWRTGAAKLGELLIGSGLISRAALASALTAQEKEVPRRSVGQILIGNGIVTEAAVNELLVRHFTHLLREIVTWRRGVFDFTFDDVWPLEDLAAFPGDTGAKVAVDTQMMLVEALSHVEELRPDGQHTAADDGGLADEFTAATVSGPAPDGHRMAGASETPAPVTSGSIAAPPRTDTGRIGFETVANFPRVQLITTDLSLAERLRTAMQDPTARVTSVLAREAGSSLPGEPAPIVVMDVRGSALSMESIRALRRTRPKACVVAYATPQAVQERIYEAGAAAVVHGDEASLAACIRGVFRGRSELSNEASIAHGLHEGFARLRRIVGELRSGLLNTTVSLNLMNAVAESLDRAILFVIQQDHLIPVGSFGLATTKQKLQEIIRGLRLSLREPSVFTECVENGGAFLSSDQRSSVPPSFRELVGAPRTGEFALLPVSGSQRVIALIYVDNGNKDRPIADLQVLELAAFQLGLALENEFLRRARSPRRPTEEDAAPLRSMG
jgi:Domain of unknown function (DUF4388)